MMRYALAYNLGLTPRERYGKAAAASIGAGVDNIPRAIDAANRRDVSGTTYVVGDVTDLRLADLGTFDCAL